MKGFIHDSASLLFLILFNNQFSILKCEEVWEKPGLIIKTLAPTYVNAAFFFTREALANAEKRPRYYERVITKCSQIFSWHNIIYRVVYEEKWDVDKINIYSTSDSVTPGQMLGDIHNYGSALRLFDVMIGTLITDHTSSSTVVGLAYVGLVRTYCSAYIQAGRALEYYEWSAASVIVHESGHCLGMDHFSGGKCIGPYGYCVMSSSLQWWSLTYPPAFAAESMDVVLKIHYTTFNNPAKLYKNLYPACGNGILEDGEECDCGFRELCILKGSINCCNYTTCKLISNSRCSDGPCCKNCQLTSGNICRPQKSDVCDYPEYCTGTSEHCPLDNYKPDGTLCAYGVHCVDGNCVNISSRCSAVASLNITTDDKCRTILTNFFSPGICRRMSATYCNQKEKICSFVACEGEILHIEREAYIFGETLCFYVLDGLTNLSPRDTDGLTCGNSEVCLGGLCTNVKKNIELCANIRCSPFMACRYGKCYRVGSTASACENVACAPHEICTNQGKCQPVKYYYVGIDYTKYYLQAYVGSTIMLLITASASVFVKEYFFSND